MTDKDKQVLAFLKEWLAWAEAGGPRHDSFRTWAGLCFCAEHWREGVKIHDDLDCMMDEGGYPFGRADYEERSRRETQHECPKRLAWVRNKIEELEKVG